MQTKMAGCARRRNRLFLKKKKERRKEIMEGREDEGFAPQEGDFLHKGGKKVE